jgi:hypothetical protein
MCCCMLCTMQGTVLLMCLAPIHPACDVCLRVCPAWVVLISAVRALPSPLAIALLVHGYVQCSGTRSLTQLCLDACMLVTALTGSRCLPLLQVVADDMVGYLIASDIEDVAAVQYEEEGAFMAWLASRPEGERFGYKWVQHWVLCAGYTLYDMYYPVCSMGTSGCTARCTACHRACTGSSCL